MVFDTYHIIYLITNFFTIVIHYNFMKSFFVERRSNIWICTLSYLGHFGVTSVTYLFVNIPIINLIVNWLMLLLITCNYKSRMENRVLASIYIIIFMAITEIILAAFTGYFHFSFLTEGKYHDSIGIILARLLAYMFSLLFKNFKAFRQNQRVVPSEWAASVFIPVTTMILEVMIIQAENATRKMVLLSLALIFVLNIVAFYLYDSLNQNYDKIAKVTVLEKENELYSRQCEIMQNSTEELQAFRHDMANQFTVIMELMKNKKYDAVEKQISNLSEKTTYNVIYSTTGNIVVDGLINYKLQCALEENIKVHSEIAVPDDLEADTSDIVVIVGNLLDNAIHAILELSKEKRFLSVKIVYSMGRLLIQMINPYCSEVQYQNGEIITTHLDTEHHGFGLKNIEKVVEKYDGYMQITPENHIFKVDILLYLECTNK